MPSVARGIDVPPSATAPLFVPQLLLALVVCNVPGLLRDTFEWPLFGDRLYLLNFYILLIALAIHGLTGRKSVAGRREDAVSAALPLALTILFVLREAAAETPSYLFIAQWTQFILVVAYLRAFASAEEVRSMVNAFIIVTLLVALFQAFVIMGKSAENAAELQRNEISYMALFSAGFAYVLRYRRGLVRLLLFAALVSAIVNSTRGIVLAAVLMIAFTFLERTSWLGPVAKMRVNALLLVGIIAGPILSPLFLTYMFDLPSVEKIYAMAPYRMYVPDNVASIISRSYGSLYTLNELIALEPVFGLGEHAVSSVKFWGYGNHNYFTSITSAYGLAGLLAILYLCAYAFSAVSRSLVFPALMLFVLGIANDLYLWLAFVPALRAFPDAWFAPRARARPGGRLPIAARA
jgi:hypothetical protein